MGGPKDDGLIIDQHNGLLPQGSLPPNGVVLDAYVATFYRQFHYQHHRHTQVPGQDPELVAIFLEEADDLIDRLDRKLREWTTDTHDPDLPVELKRTLHTLKGSARLAGMSAVVVRELRAACRFF